MHPVESIVSAIARQEGWFDRSSLPFRRNNPGDLRLAGQRGAHAPAGEPEVLGQAPPIAQFNSAALGVTALYRQVWLQVADGQTLAQLIAQWAPPRENKTSVYLANVAGWTGLPTDVPILNILPALTYPTGGHA